LRKLLSVLLAVSVLSGCTLTPIHKLSNEYSAQELVKVQSTDTGQVIILKNIPFLPELDGENSSASAVMGMLLSGDSVAQLGYAVFDITDSVESNKYLGYLPNSAYGGSPFMSVANTYSASQGKTTYAQANMQNEAYKSKGENSHAKRFYTTPALVLTLPTGKRKIAYSYVMTNPPKHQLTSTWGVPSDAIEIDVQAGKTHYVFLQRRKGFVMNREFIQLDGLTNDDIEMCNVLVEEALQEELKNDKAYRKKLYEVVDAKGYNNYSWKRFCYLISGFAVSEPIDETQLWLDENKAKIIKHLKKWDKKGVKPKSVNITRVKEPVN